LVEVRVMKKTFKDFKEGVNRAQQAEKVCG